MSQPNYALSSIKQVLENTSGYPFELQISQRVSNWEGNAYYFVEPNYSFEDPDTGEARELDFHAISAEAISSKKSEYAYIVLLGSCKVSRNPWVFFTRPSILTGITLMSDVPISGCPMEIFNVDGETEAIEWYFQLHDILHIAKSKSISSQACILTWKNDKWEIQPEAVIRDTFVPLVKVMSSQIEAHNKQCASNSDKVFPEFNIYYPLVVLKGPMYEYYIPDEGNAQLNETKHIVVIRHYESKTIKCRYAIDIIHESYLEQYLGEIEEESKKFINLVRRHKRIVAKSVDELIKKENAQSPS